MIVAKYTNATRQKKSSGRSFLCPLTGRILGITDGARGQAAYHWLEVSLLPIAPVLVYIIFHYHYVFPENSFLNAVRIQGHHEDKEKWK